MNGTPQRPDDQRSAGSMRNSHPISLPSAEPRVVARQVTEQIDRRVVSLAREHGVAHDVDFALTPCRGKQRSLATDSSLLSDGIRVLSRSLGQIAAKGQDGALNVVHHGRAVKYPCWRSAALPSHLRTPTNSGCGMVPKVHGADPGRGATGQRSVAKMEKDG